MKPPQRSKIIKAIVAFNEPCPDRERFKHYLMTLSDTRLKERYAMQTDTVPRHKVDARRIGRYQEKHPIDEKPARGEVRA